MSPNDVDDTDGYASVRARSHVPTANTNASSPQQTASSSQQQQPILQRVEVNQRALIDKILARYASASAVYRELLQNSNDANATHAEIHFTTSATATATSVRTEPIGSSSSGCGSSFSSFKTAVPEELVTQVVYRNNGDVFGTADWDRLQKIAEGNPHVDKVGAFGVGAYTMFSITEEPVIVSGQSSLAFVWQGDALYTLMRRQDRPPDSAHNHNNKRSSDPTTADTTPNTVATTKTETNEWTTFYLPSRDPYPLPNTDHWSDFGQFLCAALTFTQSLTSIRVTVNRRTVLSIQKSIVQPAQALGSTHANSNNGSSSLASVSASSKAAASFLWNALSTSSLTASRTTPPPSSTTSSNSNSTTGSVTRTQLFSLHTVQESVVAVTVQVFAAALDAKPPAKTKNTNNTCAIAPSTDTSSSSCTARMEARYITATANTHLTPAMVQRMERVTKKAPPHTVKVHIFLNDRVSNATLVVSNNNQQQSNSTKQQQQQQLESLALGMAQSFAPVPGQGRIFIGFRTSQTTGLGAHVAAPFVPTVEREAMDLQDAVLSVYNTDLLEFSGLVLRLTLEHCMRNVIDVAWQAGKAQRDALEAALRLEMLQRNKQSPRTNAIVAVDSTVGEHAQLDKADSTDTSSSSSSKGLMSFALYMARGVKKKMVSVAKSVETLWEANNSDHLLYPIDPLPLSSEEEQAIVLMSSFCPQQSTPDPAVGTALAQGFSNCMPSSAPPVLTKSGVVPGNEARLPHFGIEGFVSDGVVRTVVFQNAEEYHTVVARCRKLNWEDLVSVVTKTIWEQEKAAELIKWWTRYSRVDEYSSRSLSQSRGSQLKEIIRYYSTPQDDNSNTGAVSSPESGASRTVVNLSSLYFYTEANSPFSSRDVPLPETVLPGLLQDAIGITDLMSDALQNVWFNPLPVEIFAEYIARHDCLNAAKPEDDLLRVQVLTLLCREFMRRTEPERAVFGGLCWGLLSNRRCLPFDSDVPDQFAADFPGDLYLYSAELKAFDGFGSFCKVAGSLQAAGMTDNFLLTLGVRKSVSIDFLLTHLDTLKWNQNPKALIEYLRTASLTKSDLTKLITTKYLSAAGDSVTSYAPGELYLPNKELRILPFVRTLAWPEPEVTENSDTGKFLTRLGMKTLPTLAQILLYLSDDKLKDDQRFHVLDFVCDRLVPHGAYYKAYGSMPLGERVKYRFLPCVVHTPFGTENASISLQSPVTCFTDSACAVMCFPVINPALGKKGNIYGTLFQCESEPRYLLNQLVHLVAVGKGKLKSVQGKELVDLGRLIELSLKNVFKYLSHKCADFNYAALDPLSRESFIPCVKSERVIWYRPDEVFFSRPNRLSESLTEELFHVIDFSPFLAAAGVKEEATTKDLFQKMIESPASVLQTLGSESKYRSLLRRIAADPPFSLSRPSAAIRNSPFLLAYAAKPFADEKISSDNTTSDDKMDYHLAKADDIFVIDNSNFGRMFPVFRAPPETDLEDFYVRLGAHYISKSVDRRFEVVGKPTTNTSLTNTLRERLAERGPLLVSPNITSRPLVSGAASILDDNRLEFFEASNLLAVYTLGKTSRRSRTTCFSRPNGKKNSIFVTADFDLFDAGQAIGDLIFVRCQLEDAFFISSLLETPLHQLRARGFPVDRVIKPMPAVVPIEPKPKLQDINNGTTVANLPTIPKQRSSRTSKADILDGEFSSQKHDEGLTAAPDSVNEGKTSGSAARPEIDAKADMLKQMFPDADPDFIAAALGLNPDEDDIKELADKMANGHYPKKEVSDLDSLITEDESKSSIENVTKKKTLRNRLGRAFGGKRGNNHNDSTPPSPPPPPPTPIGPIRQNQPHGSGLHNSAPTPTSHVENRGPVSPAADAQSQNNLERMLERSVGTSNRVRKNDMDTLDSNLTSIPPDLDRGQTCEVLPGHSLKPFPGPRGNGLTHNGILVFSSKVYPSSEIYLTDNAESLRCFADVLDRLCAGVFSLNLATVAIYHDPAGVSIAFNSNRSTHYNFRFFHGLHWLTEKHNTSECYSYWYVTICHELAHHFVSGHTREHGFYCENFSQLYMPKLLAMLRSLGID